MNKMTLFATLLVMTSAAPLVQTRSYGEYRTDEYLRNYGQEVCFTFVAVKLL